MIYGIFRSVFDFCFLFASAKALFKAADLPATNDFAPLLPGVKEPTTAFPPRVRGSYPPLEAGPLNLLVLTAAPAILPFIIVFPPKITDFGKNLPPGDLFY